MSHTNWHWGLRKDHVDKLLQAHDFPEMYGMLKKYTGESYTNEMKELFKDAKWIYDKTPRYVEHLDAIIKKVDVPFIVIYKNIPEMIMSYKKRNWNIYRGLNKKYKPMINQVYNCKKKYKNRLLIIKYKSLVNNTDEVIRSLKKHIGLNDNSKLSLDNYNKKFKDLIKKKNTFDNKSMRYIKPILNIYEKFLSLMYRLKFNKKIIYLNKNSI